MEHLNKSLILIVICFQAACGVKGKPLPPLQPAHLGRGEPTFTEAEKKSEPTNKRAFQKEKENQDSEE